MQTLSLTESIARIEAAIPFTAVVEGSLEIKVDAYLPVVATAIHAGGRLRRELADNCLLSDQERYFEEDPATDQFISSQPITLVGRDSRFEYDLNRPRALSTYYKSAWSKQVWRRALSDKQRAASQNKHLTFYRLYDALIQKLESLHRNVLVYDIHSYNYRRIDRPTPVFNVGTAQIDMERWGSVVQRFCRELGRIQLPDVEVNASLDEVFQGRGYLIAHTNARFDRTLVLPTEVKKVYMDEEQGSLFPLVVQSLSMGMKEAFTQTAAYFDQRHNKRVKANKHQMLSQVIDPDVLELDRQLAAIGKGLETLPYLNPLNTEQERRRYRSGCARYSPRFRYKPLTMDPFLFKEKLYQLPFERISDPAIRDLYQGIADNLSRRVDMLTSVGSEEFRYASLRYYGRPDLEAVQKARFLLQAAPLPTDEQNKPAVSAEQAVHRLQLCADGWGLSCRVQLSSRLAAKAMVVSGKGKPSLLINKNRSYTDRELSALELHELGIHVATTLNGRRQPLQVLNLGLPGANQTQEGLAIMAEYCGGTLTLERLKTLASRVLAVDSMLVDNNFEMTMQMLVDEARLNQDSAFDVAVRVYRAGGLTKDYQYLTGFLKILELADNRSLAPLLAGKASLENLDLLEELCQRCWLTAPASLVALKAEKGADPIIQYLVRSLRH
ncbi:flavohemoglobin expression-modulating QEGLA motif protein [Ferrimonas sediminicola]|uniref:Flavohemoglobin expression-modulating QEGLA motif protein n=1 Tax=Ferrimonas sediminicola TaxID=2569538 RepID=A0A4U1BHL3_9GAMM|nr:flavohemoglobin expression-modulating QEGLA motif protein [Ferrimonas sediminicola]TKB50554.1 flavohemoglobin expression-modulating QEGLA motif protein [Ferrimonas sediminicola]